MPYTPAADTHSGEPRSKLSVSWFGKVNIDWQFVKPCTSRTINQNQAYRSSSQQQQPSSLWAACQTVEEFHFSRLGRFSVRRDWFDISFLLYFLEFSQRQPQNPLALLLPYSFCHRLERGAGGKRRMRRRGENFQSIWLSMDSEQMFSVSASFLAKCGNLG